MLFLLGIIIGGTLGMVFTAIFAIASENNVVEGFHSTCCNAPVRAITEHKCTACGKFCGVRI